MINMHRSQGGHTLAELMVSLVLFIFLTTGVLYFIDGFKTMMRDTQTRMHLLNESRQLLEKMLWGVQPPFEPERHGIWEAQSLTVVNSATLNYRGLDGVNRTLRLSGQNVVYDVPGNAAYVIYDPNGADPDDTTEYDVSLNFSQTIPQTVEIEIVLGQRIVGRWHYASISTQVALRN